MVLKCLHLLCRDFSANFPFLSSLGYSCFLRNCNFMIKLVIGLRVVQFGL